jgi:aryl-phospho-beta-D-glucosidase BglC (GH1 family)
MMRSRAVRVCLAVSLFALASLSGAASAAGYSVREGRLYDAAGSEIQLRGVSHHGFNSEILQPQYLWTMGWKEQIAQMKQLGFNAVRLPFVPDTLYVTSTVDQLSWVEPTLNADLLGKTPLQVLDLWMEEADRQGLYILLDFHSVSRTGQYPTWFLSNAGEFGRIYNNRAYSKANWIRDLKLVAKRYAHLPRFIGIDLYNEPNGAVRWSSGDAAQTNAAYYWKAAAEEAATAVLAANPKLLAFVQGINGNFDGVEDTGLPMNWGEDFQPQAYQPLAIPGDKLVLSPHTYGPDVYMKSTFGAPNYPANLTGDWEKLFGQFQGRHAVVVGEWGGRYGDGTGGAADVTWQKAFVDYLRAKGMKSSFYWCYTPNSHDTGGVLDDNLAVREDKMALLRAHWGVSGKLALATTTATVRQDAGAITLMVTRKGGSLGPVSVRYTTADGSALASKHYTRTVGTLTWADGDASARTVTVPLAAAEFSGSKNFTVTLSRVEGGATLGAARKATVTVSGQLP